MLFQFDFSKFFTLIACALFLAGCSVQPTKTEPGGDPSSGDAVRSYGSGSGIMGTITDPLPKVEFSKQANVLQPIDLTYETDDLLQRIRNGFSMPDINSDLVLSHQQRYQSRPDYLRRMIERGRPYLHHIVEEIEKRGMPMELVFLPMVESAYNPMAMSPAKASGLWQFIPSTGKRFNLDQNWWLDERRDIVASTAAALDYLQIIYNMHGDWHLALASYNWGEGSVARAISKNVALDLPTDYLNLTMPEETRNYVPKLQALKNIFSNPSILAELGVDPIPNSPYFMTVTKGKNIDVKVAAKLAGMPVEEFVALNPAHNRPVIKSDTPMVIPSHRFDEFVNNLDEHEKSQKPLSSWQSYTLRPGDKLENIAPRFGMSVANLKAINGIKGKFRVGPGYTLLVAGNSNGDPMEMMEPLPQQPRYRDPDLSSNTTKKSHVVKKGDTLHSIAKKYNVSVEEIKRSNQIKNNKVALGSKLVIQVPQKKTDSSASASVRTNKQRDRATSQVKTKSEATASGKNKKGKPRKASSSARKSVQIKRKK